MSTETLQDPLGAVRRWAFCVKRCWAVAVQPGHAAFHGRGKCRTCGGALDVVDLPLRSEIRV